MNDHIYILEISHGSMGIDEGQKKLGQAWKDIDEDMVQQSREGFREI